MLKRYYRLSQLFGLIFGFIVTIILLESAGFIVWAERLDVSKTQQQLVDWVTRLNNQLLPLGISSWRSDLLAELEKVGWNEDQGDTSLNGDIEIKQLNARTLKILLPLQNFSYEFKNVNKSNNEFNELPLILEAQAINPESTEAIISISPERIEGTVDLDSKKIQVSALNNAIPIENTQKGDTQKQIRSIKSLNSIKTPLPIATAKKPRVVALVGDSMMAVGLSAQLLRETARYDGLKMIRAFRSGTGLSRPEVFNWLNEYPQMIMQQRPDIIILAMGANDAQGFVADKKVLSFGSPEWEQVYMQRVQDFLSMLLKHDTTVLMMSLPSMRSKSFNEKIQLINQMNRAVVSKMIQENANIIWWDPTHYFENASGDFQEFIINPKTKKIVRIRSSDGIHLSDEGAGLITPIIIDWLNPERKDQNNSL